MNLNKMFYDWSNEVYVDRNNLVFEGKNQAYGAYQIRQEYNKVVLISMLTAFLGIGLLVSIPKIIQYFNDAPIVERVLPPDEGMIPLDPDLFKETLAIPPQEVPKSLNITSESTITNITPVVTNKDIELDDKLAVNDKLVDSKSGIETKIGANNDEIIIADTPLIVETKKEEALFFAEKMPSFIGGENALLEYMRRNVSYPATEKEFGISGTVYASFIINKKGMIEDAKIVRGVKGGRGLDDEALRVIKSMPPWEPAMQNNMPVKIQFTYPIHFVLK